MALYNSIPVIMHHHTAPTDRELNVNPDLFEDQLRTLQRKGWKTLSGDEFLYFLENKNDRPKKTVLITFDDGFADNYVYAFPLLKKYKMKAMIFIATDFVDDCEVKRDCFSALSHNDAWKLAYTERKSEVICTWNELREMEESGVFDIQSHGAGHLTPDMIKEKKYNELKEDLLKGKTLLEQKMGKESLHFAWPRGNFDEEAIKTAMDLGFSAIYTTRRGSNTTDNLHMIKRLPVKGKNGKWLCGKLPFYSSVLLSKIYLGLRTGI